MQENRLAWIFGSSRSGSTWLLKMLADLEGVVPIDDPHLGHHLGVWRPIPLAWAACEDPPRLSTLLEVKAEEPGYFFAERYRGAWEEPLRGLIRARFEAQAEVSAIPGGAFPVSAEGRIPLIRWLSEVWAFRCREVRRAYEARADADRILIRYEDPRGNTAACLSHVCSMIEVDPEPVPAVVEAHRLPDTCYEQILAAEAVIHAGDFSAAPVLDELEALCPVVHAVRGNVEGPELWSRLPESIEIDLHGRKLAVIHDSGPAKGRLPRLRARFPEADASSSATATCPCSRATAASRFSIPAAPPSAAVRPRPRWESSTPAPPACASNTSGSGRETASCRPPEGGRRWPS